ncbi:MAG: hypothetical protein EXR65_02155 [Dehalococcoidia bacterium]|nr:hypothetical protein [Dehalococcoidia bacterium]
MAAVLRVVGPPGSGKTLLIVSLVEALRQRGYRIASAVRREGTPQLDPESERLIAAGAVATVVVLAGGGRVTVERSLALPALRDIVAALDPQVDLLLAEGFEDAGYPAVELSPPGAPALATAPADLIAVVSSDELRGSFASFGPGEIGGLAELVESAVLVPRPEVSMQLSVDGRTVQGSGFVTDMIARPVLTMVEQLKGVRWPSAVRLTIRRRPRDGWHG